jgi:hypothetical protein
MSLIEIRYDKWDWRGNSGGLLRKNTEPVGSINAGEFFDQLNDC